MLNDAWRVENKSYYQLAHFAKLWLKITYKNPKDFLDLSLLHPAKLLTGKKAKGVAWPKRTHTKLG